MSKAKHIQNLKPFVKGDDPRRNLKGAPKKTYNQILQDLEKQGYYAPTKSEYFDLIGKLLSMTEEDLTDFQENKDNPYWIRGIITDFTDPKLRAGLMADHRDWLFGKAQQKTDITSGGEKITININTDLI